MKQRAPAAKQKIDTEELLNFELDVESSLDLDSLDGDDEVIDLVELVEKGDGQAQAEEKLEAAREEEIDLDDLDLELESAEEPEPPSAIRQPQQQEELDLSDLTVELGGKTGLRGEEPDTPEEGDVIEADLDNIFAESEETVLLERKTIEETAAGDEAEITESDLEGLLEEGFGEEAVEAVGQAEETSSPEEAMTALEGALKLDETPEEEPSEPAEAVDLEVAQAFEEKVVEPEVREEVLETPAGTSEPVVQGIGGLSEERLEMIITRVVEDVVERVAREAMTDVAERLITEAIDALKRSMELSAPR